MVITIHTLRELDEGKGYQLRMNRVLESYVRHRTANRDDTGEGGRGS
ncbi:MAG: hypothetical protein OXJ54_15735 [Gemmatimonadetes bacterium]|nr:hypothetical protein [Candidatus Palauibacter rhopaloidicola]